MNLSQDWKWVTQHLVMLAVVVLLALGGTYFVTDIIAKHDAARQTQDEKVQAQAHADTQAALKQLADFEIISNARDAKNTALIASLQQQRVKQDAQTAQQVKADQSLDASAAASRLVHQVNAGPNEIAVTANDEIVLDLPVTRNIVAELDTIPGLQADLKGADQSLAAETQKTADAQQRYLDAKAVMDKQIAEAGTAAQTCKDTISTLKAKNRKHDIIIGTIGTILGYALRVATHG